MKDVIFISICFMIIYRIKKLDDVWKFMLILYLYNASVFLNGYCIESPFVKIPQEPKIFDFLESDDEEEVNGEEYVHLW